MKTLEQQQPPKSPPSYEPRRTFSEALRQLSERWRSFWREPYLRLREKGMKNQLTRWEEDGGAVVHHRDIVVIHGRTCRNAWQRLVARTTWVWRRRSLT